MWLNINKIEVGKSLYCQNTMANNNNKNKNKVKVKFNVDLY